MRNLISGLCVLLYAVEASARGSYGSSPGELAFGLTAVVIVVIAAALLGGRGGGLATRHLIGLAVAFLAAGYISALVLQAAGFISGDSVWWATIVIAVIAAYILIFRKSGKDDDKTN